MIPKKKLCPNFLTKTDSPAGILEAYLLTITRYFHRLSGRREQFLSFHLHKLQKFQKLIDDQICYYIDYHQSETSTTR